MVSADSENGAITGEANKSRLVFYKQIEQEFKAPNKKNIITTKMLQHSQQ